MKGVRPREEKPAREGGVLCAAKPLLWPMETPRDPPR
jgi:hypothetical protein